MKKITILSYTDIQTPIERHEIIFKYGLITAGLKPIKTAGLKPVLSHDEKSCIASHYKQFSMNKLLLNFRLFYV